MNYFGAALVAISGFYVGFLKAREQKQRLSLLRDVCAMTELIRNEISSMRTPMDELFDMLAKSGPASTRAFSAAMCQRLKKLGESSFSALWSETVHDRLGCLSERSQAALCEFGASLGRYDAELQASAADRCMIALGSELSSAREKEKANEKMYIGLCGGLSLIVALVLV